MLHLSENLKRYRILKNLTQEDVAEYLRVTPQSVSKWERGVSHS
ncbi:helix-turn-helix transcriptional regulator [Fumia xinanensis]|uniref:Helix-turn-helix transcriptional regulator n=1 Tax=Fumia xinanensis TaxID=2763659 RepID=A0A926E451_9FIRM|nr:helix-turn-helix transcriptional regulator [Fumia xinanensis]MBC8559195.1 helix-turn-helix transcriptional regulator [Fumia xinanensis]